MITDSLPRPSGEHRQIATAGLPGRAPGARRQTSNWGVFKRRFWGVSLRHQHPADFEVNEALQETLIAQDKYWPPDGEEAFYSDEYAYHRFSGGIGENARLWRDFRRSLIHGQRFFNLAARDLVAAIFHDVHQQRDADKQGPVYMIDPGEAQGAFYRARVADDDTARAEIEKDLAQKLGPPPERKRRAGRLNPAGVIGFYGAFDIDTCIAELRPSVGSIVIAAQFAITAPICVLDMTRFDAKPKTADLYAKNAQERVAQWAFMQSFMREIARPISPGEEHLDYLPTQAVAEYLNQHHRFTFAGAERTIDAIIYGSAQHPKGKNMVLLGEAALVGPPPGAEPKPSDSVDERWPGLIVQTKRQPQPRIVPRPETVEKHRVAGASFTKVRVYDVGDVTDFDDEDLPVAAEELNGFGQDDDLEF